MGFNKLLWGFIFLIDIRLGTFDLLPDIVGYYLFYQGCSHLATRSERFAQAKQLALPLIYLSVVDLVSFFFKGSSGLFVLLGLVVTALTLMMIYHLCMGIVEMSQKVGNRELEEKASFRWWLYLISGLVNIGVYILPIIWLPAFIYGIIVYLLMLELMNQASSNLEH